MKSVTYDDIKVQSGGNRRDYVAELAVDAATLDSKIAMIEELARDAAPTIYPYLLAGVTEGATFDELKARGMPYERGAYYERRQRFYWLLAQRI